MRGDREKERAASGNNNFFASDGQPGFDQRLQSACAYYIGKRPAGKRKEKFACAGAKDELAIGEFANRAVRLRDEQAGMNLIDNFRGGEKFDALGGEFVEPGLRFASMRMLARFPAPD